jgi:hypothetical protein
MYNDYTVDSNCVVIYDLYGTHDLLTFLELGMNQRCANACSTVGGIHSQLISLLLLIEHYQLYKGHKKNILSI